MFLNYLAVMVPLTLLAAAAVFELQHRRPGGKGLSPADLAALIHKATLSTEDERLAPIFPLVLLASRWHPTRRTVLARIVCDYAVDLMAQARGLTTAERNLMRFNWLRYQLVPTRHWRRLSLLAQELLPTDPGRRRRHLCILSLVAAGGWDDLAATHAAAAERGEMGELPSLAQAEAVAAIWQRELGLLSQGRYLEVRDG